MQYAAKPILGDTSIFHVLVVHFQEGEYIRPKSMLSVERSEAQKCMHP